MGIGKFSIVHILLKAGFALSECDRCFRFTDSHPRFSGDVPAGPPVMTTSHLPW